MDSRASANSAICRELRLPSTEGMSADVNFPARQPRFQTRQPLLELRRILRQQPEAATESACRKMAVVANDLARPNRPAQRRRCARSG